MAFIKAHVRRFAIGATLAALLISLPSLCLAAPPPEHPHGRGDGEFMEMMFDRLELTEDQRVEMERIAEKDRERMRDQQDSVKDARRALAEQIHAEVFDEAAIRRAAAALAEVEADLAVARAEHLQDVRQVLTPEQFSELEEMHLKHRSFEGSEGNKPHHGHRGRGGPHGGHGS